MTDPMTPTEHRTVLAALADAQREAKRVTDAHNVTCAEMRGHLAHAKECQAQLDEVNAKLADAQRDRERLIEALRGAGMTIAANLGDNHPRLKEIDAAMQEARR